MAYSKLKSFPVKKSCNFCQTRISNEYQLGHIASLQDITVHYFCLLLSGHVKQRGKDEQGILGFLPVDIKKELYRGKKLFCDVCGKNGATLRCAFHKCTAVFHLPCGLKRGAMSQFYGHFRSWCVKHRPTQTVHPKVRREATECPICRDSFKQDPHLSIWPTCCKPPSTLFHRFCLQRMAVVAGYYHYKCPLCNDKTKFIKETHRLGVYIPAQEAQWELEGGFEDLMVQHLVCEAGRRCRCPRGTEFDKPHSKWKLERCSECGLNATHLLCSGIWKAGTSFWVEWTCSTCLPVVVRQQRNATGSMGAQHSGGDLTQLLDSEATCTSKDAQRFRSVDSVSDAGPFCEVNVASLSSEGDVETSRRINLVDDNVRLDRANRPGTPECLKNRVVIIDDSDDDDVVPISDDDGADDKKPTNPRFPPVPVIRNIHSITGFQTTQSAMGFVTGEMIEIE